MAVTTGPWPTRQPRVIAWELNVAATSPCGRDGDQPAVAAEALEAPDRLDAGVLQPEPAVAQQRVHLVRERGPDDRLAVTGARDRDGLVGPRAGADQRRIADAAEPLAGDAAGRGRGRQAALGVARHGADRAARARRVALGDAGERGPLALGDEPRLVLEGQAGGGGELDRRRADEQDVATVGEHRARRADRVAHAAHGRHRAGGARRAVHDRGVELDAPVLGQRRAAAGVELRVVLEHHDGGLDGVERRAAGRQHRVPGLDGGGRARAHALGALGVGDRSARAAVDHDRDLVHRTGPYHRARRGAAGFSSRADSQPGARASEPVAERVERRVERAAAVRAQRITKSGCSRRPVDAAHVDVELPGDERPGCRRGVDLAGDELRRARRRRRRRPAAPRGGRRGARCRSPGRAGPAR